MTKSTINIFIDTNGFIHLRDLKDLPWPSLFPAANCINIMIAPRIIEELDDLKTSSNSRKRDRARLALKLIETASAKDSLSLRLRDDPIELNVVIATGTAIDWTQMPQLDSTKPDDQLVAEAVKCGRDSVVFSHDTGPRIRARIVGIKAKEPPEDWFLPSEKTDDQIKIAQLERNLQRAQNTIPSIKAGFGSIDKEEETELSLLVPILSQFDPRTIARLTEAYVSKYPQVNLAAQNNKLLFQLGVGYSEHQIKDYHTKYLSFIKEVEAYFLGLPDLVTQTARVIEIPTFVKNESGVSAQGLRVEANIVGEAFLLADYEQAEAILRIPNPPKAPDPPKERAHMFDLLHRPNTDSLLGIHSLHSPRDPTGFYWFDRPEWGATHSALQCEDFRATRLRSSAICVYVEGGLPFLGELALEVSATNLPEPITKKMNISLLESNAEWLDDSVLLRLPELVGSIIRSILCSQ